MDNTVWIIHHPFTSPIPSPATPPPPASPPSLFCCVPLDHTLSSFRNCSVSTGYMLAYIISE